MAHLMDVDPGAISSAESGKTLSQFNHDELSIPLKYLFDYNKEFPHTLWVHSNILSQHSMWYSVLFIYLDW